MCAINLAIKNFISHIILVRPPGQPMPRPVLPRERSVLDRFVDYIVGDGPSNRYALICRQCQSHNGMALKEEFQFIGNYLVIKVFAFSCNQI